jgi:hypothetical protein
MVAFYFMIIPLKSNGYMNNWFVLYFQAMCIAIAPSINDQCIEVEKKVLATIWLLATPESYRSVGDRFGMAKATLHDVVTEVTAAIASMRSAYITFATDRAMMALTSMGFEEKAGMPGVIGAIDGTHIPIPGPKMNRSSYINRKGKVMHYQHHSTAY